jgi:hypothetical protein
MDLRLASVSKRFGLRKYLPWLEKIWVQFADVCGNTKAV